MDDLENHFDKKNTHEGTHGRSLIPFGLMTSSHEQKRTLFFLSVCHALFRVLFFRQFGRHWAQNIGFVDTKRGIFLFFLILAGNGRIWRKSEKKGFLDGQKPGEHGYFCATSTGLPGDFSGFYHFFPVRRHVSDVPDELCRS